MKNLGSQMGKPKGEEITGGHDLPMTHNQTASKDDYSKSNPTGAKLNPKATNREGTAKKSGQPCGPHAPICGPS